MNDEKSKEIALTAQQWLLRRQAEVSLRPARRVFVRIAERQFPGALKLRGEWDALFENSRKQSAA